MTDKTLTPRQIEALEAVLAGQSATAQRRKGDQAALFGEWKASRSMGGASRRMVQQLGDDGWLLDNARSRLSDELGVRYIDLPEMPQDLVMDFGGLSVKALEFLNQRLRSGRRYDPTDARLPLIKDKLAKRRELDAAYEAFVANLRDTSKAAYNRKRDAQAKALVADVRAVLASHGLSAQSELLDCGVRQLVEDITEAQHGLGWVRYLDDADLSAELDATEKQAVTPGTVGETLRSEKLAAIRAEFKRRQDAENDPDYSNPQ
jgi:hypothetical protein